MADLYPLWEDGTLLLASADVDSDFMDVSDFTGLVLSKTSTGGTYAFEIDWSSDGVTTDTTETVSVTQNDQVEQPIANKFARFRVKETGGSAPFTVHKTTVNGRH